MEIIFYYHRKKINSTALPIQGTFKNCSIKDVSSIIEAPKTVIKPSKKTETKKEKSICKWNEIKRHEFR